MEELYLHGMHLEQYKHHTFDPEDYYREGLRRDSADLRCNHAMGRMHIEKGDFEAAQTYLERAVKRARMRNGNPVDAQPVYDLARLRLLQKRQDEAYTLFAQASWQYAFRSASLYEMACIDCENGLRNKAVENLTRCLETNTHHFAASTLLGYLTQDIDRVQQVIDLAPQDTYARYARYLMGGAAVGDFIASRPEDVIDAALDFVRAGLTQEAVAVLKTCTMPSQMLYYHLSHIAQQPPEHTDITRCFPNRLEDIAALGNKEWQARYLLGCLYYDRMNYQAAMEAWEEAAELNPEYAVTYRNLAQVYFDHMNRPQDARAALETAFALAPRNARILYELLQLYKNLDVPVLERIEFLQQHEALVKERDDCYLDYIILLAQAGQFERARELLLGKHFNIYEGGEGKLTRHHGWQYTLMGYAMYAKGRLEEAIRWYNEALVYPDSYGEGRHYSAQEGNIYYCLGLALDAGDRKQEAEEAYAKAANQPDQVTAISYFAALSHAWLGNVKKANGMFESMLKTADTMEKNAHIHGYFGVGMAFPLPFELNIRKNNLATAYLLRALGAKGLKNNAESELAVTALREIDPYNTVLDHFTKLNIL